MRLHTVAAAYALWLLGIFVVFYLVEGKNENALQIAVMCGAAPAACQMLLLGIDWRGLVAPAKMWLAFLLVILVSYVANVMDPRTAPSIFGEGRIPPAWTPIVYTFNAAFIMAIGTLVAGCPDRRLLRSIAGLYSIISVPFLVYILLYGEIIWGRLTAGIEPNNWGLMGLTVCLGAFARKLRPLSVASFVVGAATILQASSREDLLALAIILPLMMILSFRTMIRPRLLAVLVGSCVSLILVAVLFDPYILNGVRYVNHDVLYLDSPDRGIDSGFTGRTGIWGETLDLWMKAPLLGIGYRQHEHFLAGAPAHNAYLAMLADTGLLGLVVYAVLLVWSLVASWSIRDQRTRRFVLAGIVGYIIMGFFDRRTINAGNPYGVLILMCCSVALVEQSLRKAAELYRRALGAADITSLAPDPPLPAS